MLTVVRLAIILLAVGGLVAILDDEILPGVILLVVACALFLGESLASST